VVTNDLMAPRGGTVWAGQMEELLPSLSDTSLGSGGSKVGVEGRGEQKWSQFPCPWQWCP
jgi:hypothetical protein